MKKLLSKVTFALAIVGSVAMIGQGTAYAAGAAAVTGQGSISPGLTLVSTPQSWNFTTIAAAGATIKPVAAGVISCSFSGSSAGGETELTGQGSGSGTCTGAVSVSCTLNYTRVGPVVTISGRCGTQNLNGAFVFVPTSSPVTSFVLAGTASIV